MCWGTPAPLEEAASMLTLQPAQHECCRQEGTRLPWRVTWPSSEAPLKHHRAEVLPWCGGALPMFASSVGWSPVPSVERPPQIQTSHPQPSPYRRQGPIARAGLILLRQHGCPQWRGQWWPDAGGPAAWRPVSSLGPGVSALTLHLVTVANSLPQHGHSLSQQKHSLGTPT